MVVQLLALVVIIPFHSIPCLSFHFIPFIAFNTEFHSIFISAISFHSFHVCHSFQSFHVIPLN